MIRQNYEFFNYSFAIFIWEPEKEVTDESKDADLVQASVSKSAADEDVSLTDKKEDDSKSKTSLASVPSKMEVRKYLILHSSI